MSKIEKHIRKGQISYDSLWYLFAQGNRFYDHIDKGILVGSRAGNCSYQVLDNLLVLLTDSFLLACLQNLSIISLQLACGPMFYVQGSVIKYDCVN